MSERTFLHYLEIPMIFALSIMEPIIHPIFEKQTSTWQYIVACPRTLQAAIIDPVLDYDQAQMSISTTSADALLDFATSHNYTITRLLETHAHADHLTAAYYIKQRLKVENHAHVPICTGYRIRQVQNTFARRYGIPKDELDNAFDHLSQDDETFRIGDIAGQVLHLPGHTPDHSGYLIGRNVFTGDSMFNPDVGSARCDFPAGDAHALYSSMQKLLSLPDEYKLYTGHDYPPSSGDYQSRDPMPYVTVKEQREGNKHVKGGTPKEDFVRWRQERDSGLNEPRLLHQALQVNIRGGRLPLHADRRVFLSMPVRVPESWN